MKTATLADLQASVQDKSAFSQLADYATLGSSYLTLLARQRPTRIISPSHSNYIFFQYNRAYSHRLTRPLNANLFIESSADFNRAFGRLVAFLGDLRRHQASAIDRKGRRKYVESKEINRVVYTAQQAIGSIGDSFDNPNQSRKRIGQLFENLVRLIIPVVAIFLHDVQRARRGQSIFGINSTFKSNHFLGYSIALNRLDGVYYVDPLPDMKTNPKLRAQIFDFQQFLVHDLWTLSAE